MTAVSLAEFGAQPYAMAGVTLQPIGHVFANQPSALQPPSVELPEAQHDVPLVSLGCACTTKMAFDEIGRGQKTLPFDWMCTKIEGIIGFLKSDFDGFFDFTNVEQSYSGPTTFTVFRGAHHSWWHDDPTDPACRGKFLRRIQRLGSMQAHSTPILFVRTAATTDELPMAGILMQTLQQKFGRHAKLLFVIAGQNAQSLGPYLVDGMPNMLAYLTGIPDGKGAFSDAVSEGLSWVAGQQLSNCRHTQSLSSIPGLIPAYTGMFGMGGLPAFDNIPAHVPRPPRSDGKPNNPTPALPNSVQLPPGTSPVAALRGQHLPMMQGPLATPRALPHREEKAQKEPDAHTSNVSVWDNSKYVLHTAENVVETLAASPQLMMQEVVRQAHTIMIQKVVRQVPVPQLQTLEHMIEAQTFESIVYVPQVQIQEVVRQVPRGMPQEVARQIPVPQVQTVEKIFEVPQTPVLEKVVPVPQVTTQEVARQVPRPQTIELIRQVPAPHVQTVEKLVEVPQSQVLEKVVPVPQVATQEVATQIPRPQIIELIRAPHVQTVEKIVEVPQAQVFEKVVPVPQVATQEVARQVPRPQTIELIRQVPAPHVQIFEKVVQVPQVLMPQEVVQKVPEPQVQTVEKVVEVLQIVPQRQHQPSFVHARAQRSQHDGFWCGA